MISPEQTVPPPRSRLPNSTPAVLAGAAIAIGIGMALLKREYVLLIAVLMVGAPLASLVVSSRIRPIAVILLLLFVPLTSILKAITGSRFAPLTFDLAFLLALMLFVAEGLLRYKIRAGWLDLLFILFAGWAFLQMFNPNVPGLQAGVEGLRKFAFASILFYIGRHFLRAKDIRLLQRALPVVALLIALYGLKQFFFMSEIDYRMIEMATADRVTYMMGGWVRPFSTLPGPFHLGLYLVTATLLLLARLVTRYDSLPVKIVLGLALLVNILVLFFTRTKGNWFGLAAGVIMLFYLQSRNPLKLTVRLGGLALIIAFFVSVATPLLPAGTSKALDDALFALTNPRQAPTFLYRVQLWEEIMLPALRENPLQGYGTSSAGEGLSNLYEDTGSRHFASHNLYLKIFLELGLVGLGLFFGLTGGSLWHAWRAMRRKNVSQTPFSVTFLWGMGTVTAFLVAGLAIPVLDAYPANYYFWLLLGLLSSRAFASLTPETTWTEA